jgi:lipopolysaccharide export system permease protein
MTRIDRVVLMRVGSRILLTITVVFGLVMMAESLDTVRLAYLTSAGGPQLAVLALATSAARWTIRTLSVTVLIGAVIGILDLQVRHELTVIKAAGQSIWTVMRAPLLAVVAAAVLIATFGESVTAQLDRAINPNTPRDSGALTATSGLWLEQSDGGEVSYVIEAGLVQPGGSVLNDVTIFVRSGLDYDVLEAPEARLREGEWFLPSATGYRGDTLPGRVEGYALPTITTADDLRVRLAATEDLTFFELAAALGGRLRDPLLYSAVATRFLRLLTLPLMLAGSLLIAFAFTAGYRRTNKYGAAVLYGIVLGFVVFLVTEMADRAGSAGVLDPTFAAVGPAFVAVLIGLTVLLYKEDGRA